MSSTDLSSYPGYYPPSKRPFWTRMKVGVTAALVGLFLGISGGGESSTATDGDDEQATISELENAVEEQEASASEAQDELADAEEELADQRSELKRQADLAARQQTAAVRKAVTKTRAAEQRKAKVAVAQARREAASAAAPPPAPAPAPSPQPLAGNPGGSGGTDPQFSYCYEANDEGYGNYVQGQDPEYDWYDDQDGDGRVCEF